MLSVHFESLGHKAGGPLPQSTFTAKLKQALASKQLKHFVRTLQLANFHKKPPQNKRAVPECRAISDAGENLNLQEYLMKRTI